jgi:hypothetical protein
VLTRTSGAGYSRLGAAAPRLLGPGSARGAASDRVVVLGGPQQRAVLGVLLAARDSTYRRAAPGRGVGGATRHGPTHGGRTRVPAAKRVGRRTGFAALRGDGYVLRTGPEDVDAERFRLLLRRPRSSTLTPVRHCSTRRLGLWRGAPSPQLQERCVRAARRQLQELHSGAGRACAAPPAARPCGGRGDAPSADRDEDPLREEPARLLATALQRTGASRRRKLCWATCGGGSSRSTGWTEPCQAALEEALDVDAALPGEVTGPSPTPLPPQPLTSLIGREELLAATPTARLVTLVGAPGVGKSRLALSLAHRDSCPIRGWVAVDHLDDAALLDQARSRVAGSRDATWTFAGRGARGTPGPRRGAARPRQR